MVYFLQLNSSSKSKMTQRSCPNFIKLSNYNLPDERSKVLLGVAIHYGILRGDIDIWTTKSIYNSSLKRYLDQNSHYYLNSHARNENAMADIYGVNINLWNFHQNLNVCPQSRPPHCFRKVHSTFNQFGAIHFKVDDGCISEFILNPAAYGLNSSLTINFKQAIAEKCGMNLAEVVEKWPSNELKFREEVQLHKIFGYGIELWTNSPKQSTKEVKDYVPTIVFKSRYSKKHIKLMVDSWDADRTTISIADQFTITNMTLFQCPKDYCLFASTDRFNFDRHCESCTDETIVDYEQRNLLDNDIAQWLVEEKFLPEVPTIEPIHAHYDLETMMRPSKSQSGNTTYLGEERIISIAVSDNIEGGVRSKVFAREKLDENSLMRMVEEFWDHLLHLREEYRTKIPATINTAFFKIQEMLYPTIVDGFGQKIELPLGDPLKCKLQRAHSYLDQLRTLKIAGWNSEHFVLGFEIYVTYKSDF